MENLHQKLKIVLQIRENTLRNRVQESQVSSVCSDLKNKILEMYKLTLGNRALSVPNAFGIREKDNRRTRLEFAVEFLLTLTDRLSDTIHKLIILKNLPSKSEP